MGERAIRERNKVTYTEYNDDDFKSPVKKVPKKMLIDSEEEEAEQKPKKGGLLAFAKEGINNGKKDLETGAANKKTKRAPKANDLDDTDDEMVDEEGAIEDSDLDEENEQPQKVQKQQKQQRPGRAAAPKGTLRVSADPSSDEEQESNEGSSEEEEELAASSAESSSEEEEEDEEMAEQEGESDADAKPSRVAAKKSTTGAGGSRSIHLRAAAVSAPTAGASRRSARATAAAAKTYNEDEIMQQYYSDEEGEEEIEDPEAKKDRRTRAVVKNRSFDSNEENKDPSAARRAARPQRAAATAVAVKKKPSGYATSDDDFFEDTSDNEESKEQNSEDDDDDDGAIYISSGSDGDYDANAGGDGNGDEDGDDGAFEDEEYDEETLVNSVERILALRKVSPAHETELYVKITGWSFRRARWLPRSVLISAGRAQLVRNFEKKAVDGSIDPYGDLVNGVHPTWLEIDRVIDSKENSRLGLRYLVKWRGLGHSEATWERASALEESESDRDAVEKYYKRAEAAAARLENVEKEEEQPELDLKAVPDFLNGRSLRPYQLESLEWMAKHWATGTNCILGDEMGLGKTAQSISVLAYQRQFGGRHGPFLVIAPLTTLGHWQREIETWTDMDCVVYAGSAVDRAACQKHDLFVPGSSGGGRGRRGRLVKPNVVLSSYETVLRDASLFTSIEWETVIIDEAHRMKTVGSSTRTAIADLDMGWLLLLTGTPVQNNMRELYGLLNLLNPEEYAYEAHFLERFGDERTGMSPQQVRELQKALKPILLRRMKEDVETLPEKEECIIWTQLTLEQRAYYKAIFEKQIGTLLAGASQKNVPNLRNLAMELRKVCCHPFLCDGLEDDVAARRRAAGLDTDEISNLVQASGKMLLLHKLLPKLRSEGHKVLIFSQFKIMLDVLEDYMRAAQFPCERIDGSTSSRDRQAAIDRYSKEGSDGFVFLLSTRAGGQGITLTAADTCIIYDSDWNPQNDLQAMARCHRIGQEKDVTIYRLVSKDTYEEHVFKTSSRKYGLDEAILGGIGSGGSGGNNGGGNGDELDGKKIAELLKHGAHCLDKVEEANAETEAFASEDIDQILKGRTEKRQIGGRAGNTFSIATFEVEGGGAGAAGGAGDSGANGGADDKSFWATLLPEAAAAHETAKVAAKHGHIMLAPRQRKKVSYNDTGSLGGRKRRSGSGTGSGSGNDSDFVATEDGQDSDAMGATRSGVGVGVKKSNGGSGNGNGASSAPKPWTIIDANRYFDQLMRFGFSENVGIPKAVAAAGLDAPLKGYRQEDFVAVAAALHAMLLGAPSAVPPKPPRVPSLQHETSRQHQVLGEQILKEQREAATPELKAAAYAKLMAFEVNSQKAKELALCEIERIKQQNAQWEGVISNAAVNLAMSYAASLIPPHCMRAVQDVKLAERIIKFHESFIAHLREVDLLANWAETGNQAPAFPHKSGIFPNFWTRTEDTKLLQGLFTLGWAPLRKQHECVEAVLQHREFGFTEKMLLVPVDLVCTNDPPSDGGGDGEGGDVESESDDEEEAPAVEKSAAGASGGGGFDVEMIKEDSFQVRPSQPEIKPDDNSEDDDFKSKTVPADTPAPAAGGAGTTATIAAPIEKAKAIKAPRIYMNAEWNKFRDTLVRHVKTMLQYLRKVEENNFKIAEQQANLGLSLGLGGVAASLGAGPSRLPLSSLLPTPMDTSMSAGVEKQAPSQASDSILSRYLKSGTTPIGGSGGGSGIGGGSSGMLKKILQREASKMLGNDSIMGKDAAGTTEVVEEDPIESFSDEEDEIVEIEHVGQQPQKKKQKTSPVDLAVATAAKPTPNFGGKSAAVATPGSGTVSALNVFKEQRGDFTDGASGSAQVGSKPQAGTAIAGGTSGNNVQKKVKAKSGGSSMGSQRSLFDMPMVMKYYKRGESGEAGNEADAGQQEEEVIDLVVAD